MVDNHQIQESYSAIFFNFDSKLQIGMEVVDFSELFIDVVFVDGANNIINILFKYFGRIFDDRLEL